MINNCPGHIIPPRLHYLIIYYIHPPPPHPLFITGLDLPVVYQTYVTIPLHGHIQTFSYHFQFHAITIFMHQNSSSTQLGIIAFLGSAVWSNTVCRLLLLHDEMTVPRR